MIIKQEIYRMYNCEEVYQEKHLEIDCPNCEEIIEGYKEELIERMNLKYKKHEVWDIYEIYGGDEYHYPTFITLQVELKKF